MMSHQPLITLLTDFGWQDNYVGVMKGVIVGINPKLSIIDLNHGIPRQDVAAARFSLMSAYPYFPSNTIYIAVVDPGVGSQRQGVAIQIEGGYLVGPDNGIFSGILSLTPAIAAVSLTNPQYWQVPEPSMTFHGRDIFAPVGAHLASGVALTALGETINPDSLITLALTDCTPTESGLVGYVQYIDVFGNVVTNIPHQQLPKSPWGVKIHHRLIASGKTYSEVEQGQAIALMGSHGWVEIAVNGGNAKEQLNLAWGDRIEISKI